MKKSDKNLSNTTEPKQMDNKYLDKQPTKKHMFNAIYVEEAALKYPIAQHILKKYSHHTIIPIKHYKDVFNRTNQLFSIQKHNQALILAVKDKPFLYKGPEVCQDFGHSNFYYTSFLLNCIFDCKYCYLQGMYPSANIVAFVNTEDFKNEISDMISKKPIFLATSYDTDLIGFHNIIPYMDYFYDFFKEKKNLTVEIRTKSGNQTFYKNYSSLDNLIVAFTLSPKEIIEKYEKNTPPLESRLKAVNTAVERGFKVRICLDPIFISNEFDNLYKHFYQNVFSSIDADKIVDVGFGFFRISKEFYKRIEKQPMCPDIFLDDFCQIEDVITYSEKLQNKSKLMHFEILKKYISEERIFTL
ncbi:DNA photolyase [Herbivorax sp. ANBcel31]|uniref:SPL family radical SAM protein n=1 Tax=Herbivorax sp. ANBcel31 TaxID=3069754 RepID=UPI0027AF3FBA|nr:DNA photolyase [Herbivorax sp. ANBcel31]MDQ2084926.1 DNA photolyase [Herbivorax sp. ANBcel31]